MPKPITEWDDEIVAAMFAGLPDGTMIIRQGDSITVANVRGVQVEHDDLVGYGGWRRGTCVRHQVIADLIGDSDGNHAVSHVLPKTVDAAGMSELREKIESLQVSARKVGAL